MFNEATYLDCNATTPIEPRVAAVVQRYLVEEFGNAGSRTHGFGTRALKAVERAREQVAGVVGAETSEVVFTSGATEGNNLALLGLRDEAERSGRRHVITTQIEHKAVLEPLEHLQQSGFDVDFVAPSRGGWVDPEAIAERLRPDTLAVSLMHVNNETGVAQPLEGVCRVLADHPALLHTDAAQGFGKEIAVLRSPRIDLISISGHKIYGPKGVGALIVRKRNGQRPALRPLVFGGGQEAGLRPGTLPVALVAGLGEAAECAASEHERRAAVCQELRGAILDGLAPLDIEVHGDLERTLPHVLNFSVPGLDSEAAMLILKDVVAVSNGSACTSTSYEPSHVLLAMGLSAEEAESALRWSWCHMTEAPRMDEVVRLLGALR